MLSEFLMMDGRDCYGTRNTDLCNDERKMYHLRIAATLEGQLGSGTSKKTTLDDVMTTDRKQNMLWRWRGEDRATDNRSQMMIVL